MIQSLDIVRAPNLADQAGVAHGFFTRRGGVSGGIYAGLNCGLGSKDDPDHVRENKRRVMAAMGLGADALALSIRCIRRMCGPPMPPVTAPPWKRRTPWSAAAGVWRLAS